MRPHSVNLSLTIIRPATPVFLLFPEHVQLVLIFALRIPPKENTFLLDIPFTHLFSNVNTSEICFLVALSKVTSQHTQCSQFLHRITSFCFIHSIYTKQYSPCSLSTPSLPEILLVYIPLYAQA